MSEATQRNLMEKAAIVMGATEYVPKNGWNDFHKYKYATEADILAAVRKAMAEQGIMLIPSVEKADFSTVATKSGSERLATLTVKFTLTDGRESFAFNVIGEGQDRGDKATYKAMTGALKYALLKLYLIPTGDDPSPQGAADPEKEEGDEPKPSRVEAVKAKVAAKLNGSTMPATPELRKRDLKDRLAKLGIKAPGDVAMQIGNWIGRDVDGGTVISGDDWLKADAGIRDLADKEESLARARVIAEQPLN